MNDCHPSSIWLRLLSFTYLRLIFCSSWHSNWCRLPTLLWYCPRLLSHRDALLFSFILFFLIPPQIFMLWVLIVGVKHLLWKAFHPSGEDVIHFCVSFLLIYFFFVLSVLRYVLCFSLSWYCSFIFKGFIQVMTILRWQLPGYEELVTFCPKRRKEKNNSDTLTSE